MQMFQLSRSIDVMRDDTTVRKCNSDPALVVLEILPSMSLPKHSSGPKLSGLRHIQAIRYYEPPILVCPLRSVSFALRVLQKTMRKRDVYMSWMEEGLCPPVNFVSIYQRAKEL